MSSSYSAAALLLAGLVLVCAYDTRDYRQVNPRLRMSKTLRHRIAAAKVKTDWSDSSSSEGEQQPINNRRYLRSPCLKNSGRDYGH